jgi:hypothetical protein
MLKPNHCFDFAHEALVVILAFGMKLDDFEGNLAVERALVSGINRSRPAAGNRGFDQEIAYLVTLL